MLKTPSRKTPRDLEDVKAGTQPLPSSYLPKTAVYSREGTLEFL
jgi:hypothetical protein